MKKMLFLAVLAIVFLQMPRLWAQTAAQLANKNLKIVAEPQGGRVVFKLQTPSGNDVLVAGPPRETNASWKHTLRPELLSRLSGKDEALFFTHVEQLARSRALRFFGGHKNLSLTREVSLAPEYPAAHVIDKWRLGPAAKVEALLSSFNFAPAGKGYAAIEPLDFIWTPNLRPQPNQVIADHVFRSPAIMLQKDSIFVALIPDLPYLVKHRAMPVAMDFQLPHSWQSDSTTKSDSMRQAVPAASDPAHATPLLSFGFWPWQTRARVYYQPDSTAAPYLQDTEVSYAYYLWLDHRAAPYMRSTHAKTKATNAAFRRVVDFFWEKFSPAYRDGNAGPLPATLDALAQRAWKQYAELTWIETKMNGRAVGGMKSHRLAWANNLPAEANNDVWFNSSVQTLRTAYGMYLYGKRNKDALLMQRAEKVLNLALSAPNESGIFPSISYFTKTKAEPQLSAAVVKISKEESESVTPHWVGDEGGAGFGNDYNHTFDASWTGYWLLQWADLLPLRQPEILAFCRPYADFLLKWQQPSGVIPSWFHRVDHQPRSEFSRENAETAGSALFLAELFNHAKEQRHLDAAMKAMDYLKREILPYNKWFDYETFTSGARKPFDFHDAITGQFPQSTLSMNQAAKAYLALYEITGRQEYLDLGAQVLDYALLYQQVWSPPFLSRNLFGGFGVQNTGAEWSDARQAYFAETLLDYFEATHKRAYFERAIAAMRATFALFHRDSPVCYENWAPDGSDGPGAINGIHWGTGSAATTFELMRMRTGDAYVFLSDKPSAGGVNALWIENLRVKNDSIRFNILSSIPWGRSVWIKFFDVAPGRYRVKINDGAVIPFTEGLLERSIYLPAKRVAAVTHNPPKHFYYRSSKPLQLSVKVAGAKPDFKAQLHLRAASKSGKSHFLTIPMQANLDKSAWAANLPESYKKEGTRFQYYMTWNRSGKTPRLPAATEAPEFYQGEVQPFMFADCGDDDEKYLGEEKDSWVAGFDGNKNRIADGEQWFSYGFPIQPTTVRVKITFSANGECRVIAGDQLLLDEGDVGRGDATKHDFTLEDPKWWVNGYLRLRFSDADPKDGWGPNVAWIKVEEIAAGR
jgi:hypothetical protein